MRNLFTAFFYTPQEFLRKKHKEFTLQVLLVIAYILAAVFVVSLIIIHFILWEFDYTLLRVVFVFTSLYFVIFFKYGDRRVDRGAIKENKTQ